MEPKKQPREEQTVNLSVKKVPRRLAIELRRRAVAHHRSLQGELLTILEEAVGPKRATLQEVCERLATLGLQTADESTRMIREDRDGR